MINTEAQNELAQYLYNINAEAKANGSPFEIVTDIEHWAGYGITSIEEFEHFEAHTEYWDMYKSVYGVRPRWMDFDNMTTAEINAEIDKLQGQLEAQLEAEKAEAEARVLEQQEHERRWNEALHGAPIENRIEL